MSKGGKDAASPRYIFTMMSQPNRIIFHPHDDPLLNHPTDDNQGIESEWYCLIIPMLLVNGADVIGSGWMTKIPNFNPRAFLSNLKRMLDVEEAVTMIPLFKGKYFLTLLKLLSILKINFSYFRIQGNARAY